MDAGRKLSRGGFTIIEMMVVVAIVGLLLAAAALSFHNIIRSDLRSAASKSAAAMRLAFDRATMTGMTIRVVFDIEKGEAWFEGSAERVTVGKSGVFAERGSDPEGGQQGEGQQEEEGKKASSSKSVPFLGVVGGDESAEGEEGLAPGIDVQRFMSELDQDQSAVKRAEAKFKPIKGVATRKIKLARGIRVDAVVTPRTVDPVTEGKAYVYFFPQGHSEPAVIHLADKDDEYYSVVLHPLTGQARVYPCMYRIPDDFGVSDDKRRRRKGSSDCAEKGGI